MIYKTARLYLGLVSLFHILLGVLLILYLSFQVFTLGEFFNTLIFGLTLFIGSLGFYLGFIPIKIMQNLPFEFAGSTIPVEFHHYLSPFLAIVLGIIAVKSVRDLDLKYSKWWLLFWYFLTFISFLILTDNLYLMLADNSPLALILLISTHPLLLLLSVLAITFLHPKKSDELQLNS